jgi:murein DD-endopeptidase MepM/ murein hydrolase activator NlpD
VLASARTARDFARIVGGPQRPPGASGAIERASDAADHERYEDLHTVPHLREVTHRIRSGESLLKVLGAAGVAATEAGAWIRAADAYYDLDRLHAGQAVSYLIDMQSRALRQLAVEIDASDMLVAEWAGAGVEVRRQSIPVERRSRVTSGTVRADFKTAARLAGAPEPVFAQVADVLGWEMDLDADVGSGARFRIAFEERTRGAAPPTYQLLAVQVEGRAQWHEAYYFAGRGKRAAGFYDRRGRTIGTRFLRYPVEYTRISSRFAERRFHPVLRIPRPHYGVDFAAPTGTPVRAVAAGVITRAGWHNANGRFVKIRHGGAFDTGYAHLARIAPGVTAGARVRKGQTIGYVGSSGLATGPHLHFAMYRDGRYVDPFKVTLPRARSLARRRLADFRFARTRLERALMDADAVDRGPIVTASAKF